MQPDESVVPLRFARRTKTIQVKTPTPSNHRRDRPPKAGIFGGSRPMLPDGGRFACVRMDRLARSEDWTTGSPVMNALWGENDPVWATATRHPCCGRLATRTTSGLDGWTSPNRPPQSTARVYRNNVVVTGLMSSSCNTGDSKARSPLGRRCHGRRLVTLPADQIATFRPDPRTSRVAVAGASITGRGQGPPMPGSPAAPPPPSRNAFGRSGQYRTVGPPRPPEQRS